MTETEIEKQAEEYVIKTVCKTECPVWNIHSGCTIPRKVCNHTSNRLKGYIDGAKWGAEHAIEWHDLRENPNDLPKDKGEYWTKYNCCNEEKGCYYDLHYFDPDNPSYKQKWYKFDVIAWCELPQFKE